MYLGIKLEGWLTILAILVGPLLAFAVQNWRDASREDRSRKRKVFHQLLLTLKVPMAPVHVDALNSIPLEFYSHREVISAWRLYSSHLNNQAMLKNNPRGWGEKKRELIVDLTFEIGKSLGYEHIDKATMLDNLYVPQGYEDREAQFQEIRGTLLQVLRGEHPIPVTMVGAVQVEKPFEPVEEIPPRRQPALPPPPPPNPS